MFRLRDFIHLPDVDALVHRMLAHRQGLILVAGLEVLRFLMTWQISRGRLSDLTA